MLTISKDEIAEMLLARLGPDYTVAVTGTDDTAFTITAENASRESGPIVVEQEVHPGTAYRAVAYITRQIQAQVPA